MDWDIWRIATSPRHSVQPWEIREQWSLEDLVDAHLVEDMYEELEDKAHRKAQQ